MKNKKGGELICMRPENIVEARFKLTNRQNDIMDMVFASITDDENLDYEIDILKYASLYKLKDKSSIYGELKKAVMSFEGKGFKIKSKDGKITDWFSWFSRITYVDGEGRIIVELGKSLKQIFLTVKRAIYYNISYTLNFNSNYSRRLYYYLKLYEDTGKRIDNIGILREKLECPLGYRNFADFNRYVLKPAYNEINGDSDISFEYETIKTGRKMTHIKFFIKKVHKKVNKSDFLRFTADEEVSATLIEPEEENPIKKIMAILYDSNITALEAKKIYDSSKKNLETIKKVYDYGKNKEIPNFIGWMISMVKPGVYIEPKKNYGKGAFNNYEQRPYDGSDGKMGIDELEKALLGWDKDDVGKEFQQLSISGGQ